MVAPSVFNLWKIFLAFIMLVLPSVDTNWRKPSAECFSIKIKHVVIISVLLFDGKIFLLCFLFWAPQLMFWRDFCKRCSIYTHLDGVDGYLTYFDGNHEFWVFCCPINVFGLRNIFHFNRLYKVRGCCIPPSCIL